MTQQNNIVQFQEVNPLLESDKTSLFTPNPHLLNNRLTVSHSPEIPKKFKTGYVHQVVTLEHRTSKNIYKYTLGWVTTKTATPKKAQHKIMCAVFGSDKEGLIVRDRHMLNLMADHLGAPFTIVSNRVLRGIGLVDHAINNRCTAVYTPEGYDEYLIETLADYIQKKKYKLVLITKMDGGLVQVT